MPDNNGKYASSTLFDPWAKGVTFGTAKDTVDMKESKVVEQDEKVVFRAGHFGCQSYSGMFLRQKLHQDGPEVTTKIDMHGSWVYSYDVLAASLVDERRLELLTGSKQLQPLQEREPEDFAIRNIPSLGVRKGVAFKESPINRVTTKREIE